MQCFARCAFRLFVLAVTGVFAVPGWAEEELPLLFEESFDEGADRWQPTDPAAWKIVEQEGNRVFSQFQQSKYQPPHRSPLNIALAKEPLVGSFRLVAKCQSTIKDYGHRDMCLFFGYQDPAHFYYVHLGKQADKHANQIFIVNGKDRAKISKTTTEGTPWNDDWHTVQLVRNVERGTIAVYFDDLETPAMTAEDEHFKWGQVGVGTFDDTGNWDDIRLWGHKATRPEKE